MYYCAYTTVVFLVLPAIFAYYTYGQPIVFGLIEERRVLAALGFAPLLFLGKRVSTLQFERAFLYAALIAAFFSGASFGVIPTCARKCAPMTARPILHRPLPDLPGVLLLHPDLVERGVADQRCGAQQDLLSGDCRGAAADPGVRYPDAPADRAVPGLHPVLRAKAIIWAASLSILLSPFYFYPSLLEILGLNVEFYDSTLEGVEDGARSVTIALIFDHLKQVNWLPSGSLSLMWQDGFIPISANTSSSPTSASSARCSASAS